MAVGIYLAAVLLMVGLKGTAFGTEIGITLIGYYVVFATLWLIFAALIILGYIVFWKLVKWFLIVSILVTVLVALLQVWGGNGMLSFLAFAPFAYAVSIFFLFGLFFLGSVLGIGTVGGMIFCLPLVCLAASGCDASNFPVLGVIAFVAGFAFFSYAFWKVYKKIILPFCFGFSLSFVSALVASIVAGILFAGVYSPHFLEFMYYMMDPRNLSEIGDIFSIFLQHFGIIIVLSGLVGLGTVIADADIRGEEQQRTDQETQSREPEEPENLEVSA
ncbi:hypothetical protein [Methanofollis fontis]|uniref:DUF4203 domain-containing protein n=1 Tax=Methanofollis fontis TaxID=2052832 RepID=A0A483CT81_9EURY|nr:hypothetical protein [Methanofollis fontis]TAJ43884.1 hypothetical protein CUJ86_07425 [Methanofollis fontis]